MHKNYLHCTFFVCLLLILATMVLANLFVFWPDGMGYDWMDAAV